MSINQVGKETEAERIARAVARLSAVRLADGDYAYYADETDRWYIVDPAEIESLCDYMDDPALDGDGYSHWCADTASVEVEDTDHEALDRIAEVTDTTIHYRCQCGAATGQRCEWVGRRWDLVNVRWVPESERGSADASGSGTYGAYAISLHVSSDCAEEMRYELDDDGAPTDREDPYFRLVGPA